MQDNSLPAHDDVKTDIMEIKMENTNLNLDQINQEISIIDSKIVALNKQRDELVEQRKNKAQEFIKINEIKAEDCVDFETVMLARVAAELEEKEAALKEAMQKRFAEAVAKAVEESRNQKSVVGKKTKVNPKISLPAGKYNFVYNDKQIEHGGKRPSDDIESIINGPVIDETTGKRDISKRIMSEDEFRKLLITESAQTPTDN